MADTTKTNVSLSTLQYYDTKIKEYTKKEDATVLSTAEGYTDTKIGEVTTAATTLEGRVTAVEGKADANEAAITTLNADEATAGSVKKTVADAVAKIVADAPDSFDTLKEISDWISTHTESASAMNSAIQDNSKAITALQTLIGTLPEGVTAKDVVGYIAEAVKAETDRATGIEGGLNTRLEAVETAIGDTGSIADAIAAAKTEAVNTAKAYTDELANGAVATNTAAIAAINNTDTGIEAKSKAYTDEKNTAMDTRVKALEDVPYATNKDIDALFKTV